jgi:antitoxin YefM
MTVLRWTRLRRSTVSATIVSMTVEPLRDVRNHFSDVIDRVEQEHQRVTVTRNGRPVAVILSPEDLAELEETLTVLSDPQALSDIREADAAYATGDVVRGVDAVRALRS